jgi:Spy/CpxP family protein refolding chaperone
MNRLRWALLVVGLALLATSTSGQDKKDDEPKVKGKLPPHFSKLGLSDEQKDKIHKIDAAYKAKIDDLKKKLKDLEDEQREEERKVLTDQQRAKLRELLLGEKPDKDKDKDKDKPSDKDKAKDKDKS